MSYEHVVYQEGEVYFYIPSLFRRSIYSGVTVPLLVADLLQLVEKSKHIGLNYYQGQTRCLFWRNHPLDKVVVLGCVVGCKCKFIGCEDYLLFQLDDCSGGGGILKCKCSRELALACGLPSTSLNGRRLRASGVINLQWCELDVEYFEFCDDLRLEIEHWTRALKSRGQLEIPWQLEISPPSTPEPHVGQDYIERLHTANLMEELVISSPYNCLPQDDEEQEKDEIPPTRERYLGISCNLNEANITLLRILISHQHTRMPIIELYQEISDLLDQVATFKFQQQNLVAHVKPWQQLRTELFNEMIEKLELAGLARCPNRNVLVWSPLKTLHKYSVDRIWTLLKLRCNTGLLDHKYIRKKLSNPDISGKAILDVFRETLRVICETYPQFLTNWWIDTKKDSSVMHFTYP